MATEIPKPPSFLEEMLARDMRALKYPPFEREFQFDKNGRRWRFDFAWPEHHLAVECHGLVASGKGGHQTIKGLSGDLEKHNAAVLQGWRILYFTRRDIVETKALELINQVLLGCYLPSPKKQK